MDAETRKFINRARIFVLITMACLMLITCGCGKTHQVPQIQTSGFLGNYSQLTEGGKGEAQLIYINPNTSLKAYDKVLMDPVLVYAAAGSKLSKMSQHDLVSIINYLDAAMREQLMPEFNFVAQPGPGVMRLRLAVTEAQAGNVPLDTVSTVMPIGAAINGIKRLATGTYGFTGKMGIEAELVDSRTNTRLAAAVDRRAGEKITGKFDKFNKWRAVQGACDYWAVRFRHRLAELR